MATEKKGVRLEHISKIYQDQKTGKDFYAVQDANITIAPGEFVTLLGPSGCGKTTILRMIAGFESPDEGKIFLGDEQIDELTPNKRDTAMVFQSYALLPHYNIFDNVAYGLKLRKMDKAVIREKVLHILGLVGLEGMEERMTNQLSGGQGALCSADACGGLHVIDGDQKGGLVVIAVYGRHCRERELFRIACVYGEADQSAAQTCHLVHKFCARKFRRTDQIALVFPLGVVHTEYRFAAPQRFERLFNRRKSHDNSFLFINRAIQ